MSIRSQNLAILKRKFDGIYDPKTAIGNIELLEIKAQIDEIEATFETHDDCERCDGNGLRFCSDCGNDVDCEHCEEGLIEKEHAPVTV